MFQSTSPMGALETCRFCGGDLLTSVFDTAFRDPVADERLFFAIPGALCVPCRQLYVDQQLIGILGLWLVVASLIYPFEYVRRIVAWGESDVGDYLNNFPHRRLEASAQPFRFTDAPDEAHGRRFDIPLDTCDLPGKTKA